MRLRRNVTGRALARAFERVGYRIDRQTGSHLRPTCPAPAVHHLTLQPRDPLKLRMPAAIFGDAAARLGRTRDELLRRPSL
ncbi:MAG: type II toxin-antitoxin system HicA family toxin [Betaproteobacteria bacterium]